MGKRRENSELVVMRHLWPALVFAALWLLLPHTCNHIDRYCDRYFCYGLLVLISIETLYRTRLAHKHPNARILQFLPFIDAAVLAISIRLTGGVDSELWLFYYFQLITGAMDPRPRTLEVMTPLIIVSFLTATLSDVKHSDWEVVQIVGTRLFFLFLTALLARQIVRSRNILSDELGRLSEQLSLSQERNRISREIHDGVGHSLVNCILTLELCERLVDKKPDEALKIIRQEKTDLRSALDEMRDYVHHLRPAEIENEEFVPLVQKYLTRFSERTGVKTQLDSKSASVDLPPSNRLVLLRIMQEALTNAAKHSDATEMDVSIARTGDGGVHCIITDNGCGFDEEEILSDSASRQGFGLRTMIDRASSIGGDLQVESEIGEGTRISVYIPG